MFCRNCGKELTGTPEICLGCGAKPLAGNSFCQACGAETNPLAEICIKCGVRLGKAEAIGISPKSRLITTLLAWFLGMLGVHRFYLGKIGTGIAMIFTLGGLGIWYLVDFIMAVTGTMTDTEGKLIKNWNPSGSEQKTPLPMTAGILSIIAGALSLISGITTAAMVTIRTTDVLATDILFGLGLAGIPSIVFGIIAIVGGYFALQRRVWGMALIGAIFALLSTWGLGLLAIIFTAVSKREFEQS